MSDKYKMISELGLKVAQPMYWGQYAEVVSAYELERVLANGVRVYGQHDSFMHEEMYDTQITDKQVSSDTHSGLLINYKPIEKLEPVSKEELIEFFRKYNSTGFLNGRGDEFIDRLEKAGLK